MFEVKIVAGAEGFRINTPGDTPPAALAAAWTEFARNPDAASSLGKVTDVRIRLVTGGAIKKIKPRGKGGDKPAGPKKK